MEIIPHAGFSLFSFLRAIPGILILVLISYFISVDRKNIPWRTVITAFSVQLLIGVCILKVSFVKIFFEKIGEIFIDTSKEQERYDWAEQFAQMLED